MARSVFVADEGIRDEQKSVVARFVESEKRSKSVKPDCSLPSAVGR